MDENQPVDLSARIENEGVPYAGFGLVYEKFVFSELVSRLIKEFDLETICEYPANNFMGNNSDVFVGCEITRLDAGTSEGRRFDLVWNFCEFEQAADPAYFIEKAAELSNGLVLVVTQNIRNPGVLIHRVYHALEMRRWDHGKISRMSYNAVKPVIQKEGFEIIETGAFDAPWFILDVYESGKFLRKLTLDAGTNEKNLRKSVFEECPMWIRSWLAHHHYVLFRSKASRMAPTYEVCKRDGPWFRMYLSKAINEYRQAFKIQLSEGTLGDKLNNLIQREMDLKRQGYYFAIGFVDDTCNLCDSCTRPLTCDKPMARPSWKMLPVELQRRYNLKDGDGLIFVE